MKPDGIWQKTEPLYSIKFTCGYCGSSLATRTGYNCHNARLGRSPAQIYICHFCNCPSFFADGNQVPGSVFGAAVADVPALIEPLYEEARRCLSVNACTAAAMCCRKVLMNVAVEKGADPGKSFVYYVDYLSDKNYVPPGAKSWVDHIRKIGNEATHEIHLVSRADAEELVRFTDMLLRIIYEFPASVTRRIPPTP